MSASFKERLIILTVHILKHEGKVTWLMARGDACIGNPMLLSNNLARW
jgi:hypothetical protein